MESQVSLEVLEHQLVNELRKKYSHFPADFFDPLVELFQHIKILFVKVADSSDSNIYQGQLALMGLLNRTYQLLTGCIQQLIQGNGHVWSACLRGLMETFGAVVYVSEAPDRIIAFFQHGINAGKLRAAADRGHIGLGKDIDRLNNMVHPADRSFYSGFKISDESQRVAVFALGLQSLSNIEAQEGIITTVNTGILIVQGIEKLLEEHPQVIRAGKAIAKKHQL